MMFVARRLFWFYITYHVGLQGGHAASCTSGFPSSLVYSVSFPTGPSTRLIPEMNFTCSGVIVGYTAALMEQSGDQDPVIQVWRESTSQPDSYYKTSPGIAIDKALCIGGLTEDSVSNGVFHCNLNQSMTRVSVQPGDILGLELPPGSTDDVTLAFARVSRGPTNYVFTSQGISSPVFFSSRSSMIQELPQITLEIESGSNCTRGFPDIPASTVGRRTTTTSMTTLLIPEMNFTCIASIVGFIVAGRALGGEPHSQIQIWHKNSSQNSTIYYRAGISVNVHVPNAISGGVCMAIRRFLGDTYWCILNDNLKFTVQPGDILELVLPNTNNDEIFFTDGGPVNYVFNRQDQLGSSVNLSCNGSYLTAQQLPQIAFNLTSVSCISGFPDVVSHEGSSGRGLRDRVTTRLFPDMKFGCFGTIVSITAAVVDNDRTQNPKIQIWRENKTQSDLYHKIGSDLPLNRSGSGPCYRNIYNGNSGLLQCILNEDHRIPVQPGDFLGLEIPPTTDDDLEIYFKFGGPTNLVFQGQLNSTVNLSTESHFVTNDEPQITFLVVLDENTADVCPCSTSVTSTISNSLITTQKESNLKTATAAEIHEPESTNTSSMTTIIMGMIMGITIMLLVATVLFLVAFTIVKQRKWKLTMYYNNPNYNAGGLPQRGSHFMTIDDDHGTDCEGESCPNPAYGVSDRARGLAQRQALITDYDKEGTCPNPAYGVSSRDITKATIFNDQTPEYDEINVNK